MDEARTQSWFDGEIAGQALEKRRWLRFPESGMSPEKLRQRIVELTEQCRRLEPAAATRQSQLKEVSAYTESYLDGARVHSVFSAAFTDAAHRWMPNFSESPRDIGRRSVPYDSTVSGSRQCPK